MKNIVYAIIVCAMALQSCSHTIMYMESEFQAADSRYPAQTLLFAYNSNNKRISPSLALIGNRIFNQVTADSEYKTALSTAVDYEKNKDISFAEYEKFAPAVSKSKDFLKTIKSSKEHQSVIDQLSSSRDALSGITPKNFWESWKRVYQLSHRGIIQHYMALDADYQGLSVQNKALVYGYLLKMDISNCGNLAYEKLNAETEMQSSILKELGDEIASRESILKKIQQQKKAEEERLRKKREAEERARQEQIDREEAQRRWANDSWLGGAYGWALETQYGEVFVYINTNNQTIIQRFMPYNNNPRKESQVQYSGRYVIQSGTYRGVNCKFLSYNRGTTLIVYPDNAKLSDVNGRYFHRTIW